MPSAHHPSGCKKNWPHALRFLAVVLAALVVMGTPAPAAAQLASEFKLIWQAPRGCSLEDRVLRKLDVLLGAEPYQLLTAPMLVIATVTRADQSTWRVNLALTQQGETRLRTLAAHSCEELADATALLVALAIDPELHGRIDVPEAPAKDAGNPDAAPIEPPAAAPATEAPTESAAARQATLPAVETPAAPQARETLITPVSTRPHQKSGLRHFVGLGPLGEFGVLPRTGLGLAAIVGIRQPTWRFSLLAVFATSSPAHHPTVPSAQAEIRLASARLFPCWVLPISRWVAAGPCGALELGLLWGHGEGLPGTTTELKQWGSARAVAHGELHTGSWLGVSVEGDVGVPFGRAVFVLGGAEVHRPATLVGSARVLTELHFP